MTFGSRAKIITIRTIYLAMVLFTISLFSQAMHEYSFWVVWCSSLIALGWFNLNIVQAKLDANGLTYRRFNRVRQVSWKMIDSVILWQNAGGVIVRLEGRGLLTRYKFLFDSHPGMEMVSRQPSHEDSIEVKLLRHKITGSIL